MKLYFENREGISRQIAECKNETEVMKAIHKFIADNNKHKPKNHQFKSYYTRVWVENGKTWYDVGSHCEFFWVNEEIPQTSEYVK